MLVILIYFDITQVHSIDVCCLDASDTASIRVGCSGARAALIIINVGVGHVDSIGPSEYILVAEEGIAARVSRLVDILQCIVLRVRCRLRLRLMLNVQEAFRHNTVEDGSE